jgi:hypothetical protein
MGGYLSFEVLKEGSLPHKDSQEPLECTFGSTDTPCSYLDMSSYNGTIDIVYTTKFNRP